MYYFYLVKTVKLAYIYQAYLWVFANVVLLKAEDILSPAAYIKSHIV